MKNEDFKSLYTSPAKLVTKVENSDANLNFELPDSVDWVQQGAVGPVVTQRPYSNSIYIAAANNVSSVWYLAGNDYISLSSQELLECVGAFDTFSVYYFIQAHGITSAANYPETPERYGWDRKKIYEPVATIQEFLFPRPRGSPAGLEVAIARGPVTALVDTFDPLWQNYKGGVISTGCGTDINHAVLIVGYNLTASTPYYIVQNTWGVSWGINGYFYIEIAPSPGTCGIQLDVVYPVV